MRTILDALGRGGSGAARPAAPARGLLHRGVVHRAAIAVVLCGAALVVLPEAAAACPVCFDARDENRQAFLATTAFLSLLPLGMVAGAGLWIRKRSRERDELHGDPRDENRPEP